MFACELLNQCIQWHRVWATEEQWQNDSSWDENILVTGEWKLKNDRESMFGEGNAYKLLQQ